MTPDSRPSGKTGNFRSAPLLATAVLCGLAAVLVTWPLARHMGSATLRSGEVLLTAWQLNWFHHALLTNPLAWADANIFFPYEDASTFNDLLVTHALATLPAAWAESPVLALNLALLGGIVLCGLSAHLLIDELVEDPWAATVGGTLFALSPFRFLHLGHLSIAAAWAVPLFFWALLRHLRQPSWRRAVLATGCGVAVGLSSLYHAAYLAPIVPLVVLFGVRRGPGGLRVWLPLLAFGLPALALLTTFLVPYATTLETFGAAAAPSDLLRYGADLSSLAQKPEFLGGTGNQEGINPEAHLYPGSALSALAAVGAVLGAASLRRLRGWQRHTALGILGLATASGLGFVFEPEGWLWHVWTRGTLAFIWVGPLVLSIWAVAGTSARQHAGPAVAIRLGIAGTALSFALALGSQARYLTTVIGPAPYWLLAQASSAFEGTRVPARFGGMVMLFLAMVAAGTYAALVARRTPYRRVAGLGVAGAALLACSAELPLPRLPHGNALVPLPRLENPAYRWIGQQPGTFGVLELPDWSTTGGGEDYEYRGWRALRYMLASKQHGKHLVNGTGRIEPFLWQRFRRIEPWTDDFFGFIAAYFPVKFVLVHEAGIPPTSRGDVLTRLDEERHGWQRIFGSNGVRVYAVDRGFGRGPSLDRLFLRREIGPRAKVAFSARVARNARVASDTSVPQERGDTSTTLELLRDRALLQTWELNGEWRDFHISVPIEATAPTRRDGLPGSTTLFRWRLLGDTGAILEIRNLSVEPEPDLTE